MSSLAVDKLKKKVTLALADQSQHSGYIYLSPYSELGVGRQSILEALTREGRFIPFENHDGEFSFLSHKNIVWLATMLDPAGNGEEAPSDRRNVTLHLLDGKRLRGDIVMAMPEEKSRLSDWLNEAETFVVLQDEKREVLVNLDFVSRVV